MKPADVCIAVLVAVIWGLAFVASRIALNEFSPELMTTLRFAIAALPCLLVPRPKVSWWAACRVVVVTRVRPGQWPVHCYVRVKAGPTWSCRYRLRQRHPLAPSSSRAAEVMEFASYRARRLLKFVASRERAPLAVV